MSPGRNFDSAVCSVCGAPTAWPLTLVMTDPAVTPAFAAGLAQIGLAPEEPVQEDLAQEERAGQARPAAGPFGAAGDDSLAAAEEQG